MKKALALMAALMAVFVFVAVASAAGGYNRTTEPTAKSYVCSEAEKCAPGTIPCPADPDDPQYVQGVQISGGEINPAYPFDYDGKPYVVDGFGTYGYDVGYNYDPNAAKPRNCKFVFDVCSCGAACEIVPGAKMGIQMTIETKGVYWARPDYIPAEEDGEYGSGDDRQPRAGEPTVFFDMYSSADRGRLCSTTNPTNLMKEAPYYEDAETGGRLGSTTAMVSPEAVRNFGVVKYYRNFTYTDPSTGESLMGDYETPDGTIKFRTTVTSEYASTPLFFEAKDIVTYADNAGIDGYKGAIPAHNKVKILESLKDTDYVFTEDDTADADGACKIWVDIPAMRVDPYEKVRGENVIVRVRLLFNRNPSGICPECDPPDVCDVALNVGVICPAANGIVVGNKYCMFFPYALQQDPDGWGTGIGISALGSVPDNAEVTLELGGSGGALATYNRMWGGSALVWAFMLDNELDNFDKTVTPGAASLRVITNFPANGFQIMVNTDRGFGAGANATGCGAGQCCPTVYNAP